MREQPATTTRAPTACRAPAAQPATAARRALLLVSLAAVLANVSWFSATAVLRGGSM